MVARVLIGILQNIFRSWAIIFFSKSKGHILDELRVSFKLDFHSVKASVRSTNCRRIRSNACAWEIKWRWTPRFQRQESASQKLNFARQIPYLLERATMSSMKWIDLGHFLKSQGKFFLPFLCTLFYIFLTPKNYKSRL